MTRKDFWYIGCRSQDLKTKPLATKLLDEWIVLFRDGEGKAHALQDRCAHRCAQLSKGKVINGELQCPYHGWTYRGDGKVTRIPSEGPGYTPSPNSTKKGKAYATIEQDDYVYVCIADNLHPEIKPFRIPDFGKQGFNAIRLINRFQNNIVNCAENFVDIPHTVSVHPGIFRKDRSEKFGATVRRHDGAVHVRYHNERNNLGYFSWFLNPDNREIIHTDEFHMPNVTTVRYEIGPKRIFNITSQSIPVTDSETLVYTDLTYYYGIWTKISGPIVRRSAQTIIDQDMEILANQMRTIEKYGAKFMNSESDAIHVMIESIAKEIEGGRDPRQLPEKNIDIEFWV